MRIAIYGPRPSVKMDDIEKITDELTRFCAVNRFEINVPLTLGYNLALINKLRIKQGGGYNIYSWGNIDEVIETWKDRETIREILFGVMMRSAKRFVVASGDKTEKRSRKIRKRNKILADDSDYILVISPEGKLDEVDVAFWQGYCEDKVFKITDVMDVMAFESHVEIQRRLKK